MTTMNNATEMPKPKVIINRTAYDKIRYLVNKDSQEISGLGITRVVGDTIFVDDVKMLEQKNGAAHTDIDADAAAKLLFEWRDRVGEVNFWWHSHVNMAVYWSHTDKETIKQLAQQGMCVAAVFNKKNEVRTAVACRMEVPFAEEAQVVIFDELTLFAQSEVTDEMKAAWDKEHEESVKKPPPHRHVTGLTSGARTGGRRGGVANANFFPTKTRKPGYWDSWVQGYDRDVDWINARYDRELQLYKKSDVQAAAETKWYEEHAKELKLLAGPDATPPAGGNDPSRDTDEHPTVARFKSTPTLAELQTANQIRLWQERQQGMKDKVNYALSRVEIVDYDPILDMFEFYTGSKMDASSYMSPGFEVFRETQAAKAISLGEDESVLKSKDLHELAMEIIVEDQANDDMPNVASEEEWERRYQ